MPLSRCPRCGFACRALLHTAQAPRCPECDSEMSFIGRAALDEARRSSSSESLGLLKPEEQKRVARQSAAEQDHPGLRAS